MTSSTEMPALTCDAFISEFTLGETAGSASVARPLDGKTVCIKDNIDIAVHPTGAGHPLWVKTHPVPETHAPVVESLLAAGATITGKTHLDELAYSLMGANAQYGTPPNPAAPERVPGGSSSGSASAVAAGLCDIGIGSDTGGSVRMPASFCGLFGLRPTHGIIPLTGIVPLAPSFDTVGLFTRDLANMQVAASTLIGGQHSDTPQRWLMPGNLWELATPETVAALRAHAETAARAHGASLEESDIVFCGGPDSWLDTFRTLQAYEAWQALGEWIARHEPQFGPGVAGRFAAARDVTQAHFEDASAMRDALTSDILAMLGGDTAIILPTAPGPAPLRTAPEDELDQYRARALKLLCLAGLCQLPQLTLPLATVDDAPVGLSIVGPPRTEAMLLDLAQSFI